VVPRAVRNVTDPEHRSFLNTLVTLGLPGHLPGNFHTNFVGMYLDPTEASVDIRSMDAALVEGLEQRGQRRQRFNREAYDRMLGCRHVMAEFPPGEGNRVFDGRAYGMKCTLCWHSNRKTRHTRTFCEECGWTLCMECATRTRRNTYIDRTEEGEPPAVFAKWERWKRQGLQFTPSPEFEEFFRERGSAEGMPPQRRRRTGDAPREPQRPMQTAGSESTESD